MEYPNCRGRGEVPVKEECSACHGTGEWTITDDYGQKRVIRCFTCRGRGYVEDMDVCSMCGGSGEV